MSTTCLSDTDVHAALASMPGWSLAGGAVRRTYRTDGWSHTLMVVNAIGFVCEAADHHPDLLVRWSSVDVALSTHSAGGITVKDLAAAAAIDAAILWRPPPEGPLAGRRLVDGG